MKLIYCPECGDVVALRRLEKTCDCGQSKGRYLEDGLHAVINERAIPLGFTNDSFREARGNRPPEGLGSRFVAFVIPVECPTVEVAS